VGLLVFLLFWRRDDQTTGQFLIGVVLVMLTSRRYPMTVHLPSCQRSLGTTAGQATMDTIRRAAGTPAATGPTRAVQRGQRVILDGDV
jgi:hypothetical protein